MPNVAFVRTWRDAIEQLDMEQGDAIRAFVEGRELSGVAKALHRDVPDATFVLGDALVYLGNRLRDQARAAGGQPLARRSLARGGRDTA